jgi:hypothetical protein
VKGWCVLPRFDHISVRPSERLAVIIGVENKNPIEIEVEVIRVDEEHVHAQDIHNEVHLIPYKHIRKKLRDPGLVDAPIQIHNLKVERVDTLIKHGARIVGPNINVRTKYVWKNPQSLVKAKRVLSGILDGTISVYDLEWEPYRTSLIV